MINYATMILNGATMYMTSKGTYHIMHNGIKHELDAFDAARVRKHPSIKKSRSNVWVRRKPRFRSGAQRYA